MRVIHKLTPDVGLRQYVVAGGGFKPLAFQMQHNAPALWYEIDTSLPPSTVTIHVVGTGWDVPEGGRYIGTCQTATGDFVWHAYHV